MGPFCSTDATTCSYHSCVCGTCYAPTPNGISGPSAPRLSDRPYATYHPCTEDQCGAHASLGPSYHGTPPTTHDCANRSVSLMSLSRPLGASALQATLSRVVSGGGALCCIWGSSQEENFASLCDKSLSWELGSTAPGGGRLMWQSWSPHSTRVRPRQAQTPDDVCCQLASAPASPLLPNLGNLPGHPAREPAGCQTQQGVALHTSAWEKWETTAVSHLSEALGPGSLSLLTQLLISVTCSLCACSPCGPCASSSPNAPCPPTTSHGR